MGDLLPGLVNMLEERFGPAGRPLSTAVLAAASVWIILAGIDRLVKTVIAPLVSTLQGPFGDVLLWRIGSLVLTLALIAVIWAVAHYVLVPRLFREVKALNQETKESIETGKRQVAQLAQLRREAYAALDKTEQLLGQFKAEIRRKA